MMKQVTHFGQAVQALLDRFYSAQWVIHTLCDANDLPRTVNENCTSGFRCRSAKLDFIDPGAQDHITAPNVEFISLTIHVVDASNVPEANNLIATYVWGWKALQCGPG